MVDFMQLQHAMKELLQQDKTIKLVTTQGPTLEAAVADAAVLLEVPVKRIEYEVTSQGSPGFLGVGQKDWIINAYGLRTKVHIGVGENDEIEIDETEAAHVVVNKDGAAFLQLRPEGALLKVVSPVGSGREVTEADVMHLIRGRQLKSYDEDMVSTVIRESAGEYIRIGEFERHISNDSWVSVEVSEDEMQAFITVSPPGPGGCDVSFEGYMDFLKTNGVKSGINEDFLNDFADKPMHKERVQVAEGSLPVDGKDAYVEYNFDAEKKGKKFREGSSGRVDFKEMNIIKNVFENQVLAKMIPPEAGKSGRTVKGKSIPAKNGKDKPMPLGNNVHLGEDGATIISNMNGQVILSSEKISVEPIYMVEGNVNLKTGNIIFLGTVIVRGNVEDGFSVKATGNIEVGGTVEKAELDAEGNIIVNQGVSGKGEGVIKAGGSIWARFIENTHIEAGGMVIVSDGIINSQVDAYNCIVCHGKRAHIVGGRLRALDEINAKIIGSPTSGTTTICEVGVDPKSKARLDTLWPQKYELERELEGVTHNLQTLINIKRQRKFLPEDKEAAMQELMEKRNSMINELQALNDEITKITEFLNNLKGRAKVSASSKVYPGVKVTIRDIVSDINNEHKAVTFILENNLIKMTKYEDYSDDVQTIPEGYS